MKRSGNTVLITGGSAGIGLALAAAFLHTDNEVIICGRNKTTLDSAKVKYPNLHCIAADVSQKLDGKYYRQQLPVVFQT